MLAILGAMLAPLVDILVHLGAKLKPTSDKMAPKIAKRCPKRCQDDCLGGKMSQDGAQANANWELLGSTFDHFGRFWDFQLHTKKYELSLRSSRLFNEGRIARNRNDIFVDFIAVEYSLSVNEGG